jgi:hypothetical protein
MKQKLKGEKMAKFNSKTKRKSTKTTNIAGGTAYKASDKLALVSWLLTSFVKDKFYKSTQTQLNDIQALVQGLKDKSFAAKAAVYARNEFGMRSASHFIASEIAKNVKGAEWTKDFFNRVIRRPDDILEIWSCYQNTYGKPIPNCMKKGLRSSFAKFDRYQLAKYRGENRDISLVDVVNMLHPKEVEKNEGAISDLINGKLVSENTWEAKLTQAGQNASSIEEKEDLKGAAWKELLTENKLGYFAALRNINNIVEQADDETVQMLLKVLVNKNMIKKSLVLPFRFVTALENLKCEGKIARKVKTTLNKALDIACNNVPQFEGDTLVVVDYSGSMGNGRSDPKGIGSLFGAILAKASDADFMIFGCDAAYIDYDPTCGTLKLASDFMLHNNEYLSGDRADLKQVGHGTDIHSIFKTANKVYDRIVIFSDMQTWIKGDTSCQTSLNKYKQRTGASNVKVYTVDLTGYGELAFPEQNVYCLAGWSEKIFDIMKLLEQDRNALIKVIENVRL